MLCSNKVASDVVENPICWINSRSEKMFEPTSKLFSRILLALVLFAIPPVVSAQTANPCTKIWSSSSGNHQRTGTLIEIFESSVLIRVGSEELTVKKHLLCRVDQAFIECLTDCDLTDLEAVSLALDGIEIERFLLGDFTLRTLDGQEISSSIVRKIDPVQIRITGPDGLGKTVECRDLDENSKRLIGYSDTDAKEFELAKNALSKKRSSAFRAYRLLSKADLAAKSSSSSRPSDDSGPKNATWGHIWLKGSYHNGEYVPGRFRSHPNDTFYAEWSPRESSAEYAEAIRKAEARKAAKRIESIAERNKRLAALAERRRVLAQLAAQNNTRHMHYSIRRTWVNEYYRRDGTHVRGHWRYYD